VAAQNTFCNHCGAALSEASATPPTPAYEPVATPNYAQAPPSPGYAPPQGAAPAAGSGGLSETAAAAISYITIIPAILFLVIEPYNKIPLVRFHSFQSIGLAVVWVAVWVASMILHMVLHFIPLIGILFFLFDIIVAVGFFVAWLMCILKASKGEWFKLPVIGDFAEKQARS
ncbi:MAG: hypothetical protein ABI072_06895, partial [Edaphobacter sp.]